MDERDIFIQVIQAADPAQGAALVQDLCGQDQALRQRVEALLDAHGRAVSFLESPPAGFAATADHRPISERPGAVIGPYKLLQQIGEGGMGVVFMAEQTEPLKRTVALKIIKPGMDTRQVIARFEAERQALALMDHPNIAKVLDAGTTDSGRPYFVMELVKGVPITKYCDEKHLPLRERLELMLPVCQAVQHAHQKGLIHRDIKPSNVLVAEYDDRAVPKVIDFGVAKATAQKLTDRTMFTEFGQVIGTVEYMSPEQAKLNQLDIDTRSDIYSLGVLLYELLTGSTPFGRKRLSEAAFDEMLRIIREEEPPKPSTRLSTTDELPNIAANRGSEPLKLNRLVRGELDWVVMKALEKDRNRRYETANGLAQDIGHYLADEAVQACPPSAAYRFHKFARRNRAALATALLVSGALALGTVVSTWQAIRATRSAQLAETARLAEAEQRTEAERQRQQAEANEKKAQSEAAKSQQVAQFLSEMFRGPSPWGQRGYDTKLLLEIMDRAADRIGTGLTEQPDIEADLRNTIGFTYWSIEEFEKSEAMYRRALELNRKTFGDEHPRVANSLTALALTLRDQGKRSEAEKLLREALAMQRKLLGSEHPDVANTLRDLGLVLGKENRAEAESVEREALAIRRRLYGSENREVADSLNRLAGVLGEGQHAESEALLREAVAMTRKLTRGSPDTTLGASLYTLAINLQHQGKLPEAEAAVRESLSMMSKATGNGSSWTASPLYRLTVILNLEGKTDELEQVFNEYPIPSVGRYRDSLLMARAVLLRDKGKLAEAENSFREALAIRQQTLGDKHPVTTESLKDLIDVLQKEGKLADADLLRREMTVPADATSPPPSTEPMPLEP
jgi:eukaryotic-like serine/threonine-protein kinase